MTLAWQLAELPQASIAVKVTVFVPAGNEDGALLVIVTLPPQLSVAVTPCRNAAIAGLLAGTVLLPVEAPLSRSSGRR